MVLVIQQMFERMNCSFRKHSLTCNQISGSCFKYKISAIFCLIPAHFTRNRVNLRFWCCCVLMSDTQSTSGTNYVRDPALACSTLCETIIKAYFTFYVSASPTTLLYLIIMNGSAKDYSVYRPSDVQLSLAATYSQT